MKVLVLLHPSYILRGQWALEPAQVLYLKRLRRWLAGEPLPSIKPTELPPGAIINPTLEQVAEYVYHPTIAEGVAVDIECAGNVLVAIGMCRVADEVPICVPFRRQGGDPWWPSDMAEAILFHIDYVLGSTKIPKMFQNGAAFDIPMLESWGFTVNNYTFDTMIAAHTAFPEMPKGLQFLGILYGGMPLWKNMVKTAKDETEDGK